MAKITRDSLRVSSKQKMIEAKFLIDNDYIDLSFYLIGYAIEFALKACVCKNLDIDDLFCENRQSKVKNELIAKFKTHDYESLIILSGLYKKKQEIQAKNEELYLDLTYIFKKANWKPDCRYYPVSTKSKEDVIEFFKSAKELLKWIENYW
jgi:HEPN domain-containing protein